MTSEEREKMKQMESDIANIILFTDRLNRELFGDHVFQQPGLIEALRWVQTIKSRSDSGAWITAILIGILGFFSTIVYIITQLQK